MKLRNLRVPIFLVLISFGLLGCSGLNPALIGTLGGNSSSNLPSPEGTIIIMVMNGTNSPVLTKLRATKANLGTVELNLVTLPFDDPTNLDHVAVVQDCDLASIAFDELQFVGIAGPERVPFARSPLIFGESLFCGNVVTITHQGSPPNIQSIVTVY